MGIKINGNVILPNGSGFIVGPNPSTPIYTIGDTPTASEGNTLSFTVTRSIDGAVETVNYSLSGTATSGVDYTAPSGSVVFQANDLTKTITITTLTDSVIEGTETLVVTLTSVSGNGMIGSPSSTSGSITNTTGQPTYTIANAAAVAEGGTLSFTVSRTTTGVSETVFYTVGGSASMGPDYSALSGNISFASGDATKTISVPTTTDSLNEGTETLTITLTSVSGSGSIGSPSIGYGDITDATANPSYSVAASSNTISESSTFNFIVTRATTGFAQNVAYSLSGNATLGTDYTVAPGGNSVSFAANALTANVTVTTLSDFVVDNETITMTLTGVTGTGSGSIGSPSSATVTVTDVAPNYSSLNIDDRGAPFHVSTGAFPTLRNASNNTSPAPYFSATGPSFMGNVRAFGPKTSGKWYFETYMTAGGIGYSCYAGLASSDTNLNMDDPRSNTNFNGIFNHNGNISRNGVNQSLTTAAPYDANTRYLLTCWDADNNRAFFGTRNNSNTTTTWATGSGTGGAPGVGNGFSWTPGTSVRPFFQMYGSARVDVNFGQTSWFVGPPSGYNGWTT